MRLREYLGEVPQCGGRLPVGLEKRKGGEQGGVEECLDEIWMGTEDQEEGRAINGARSDAEDIGVRILVR